MDDHHLEYWIETCRFFCSFWQSRSRCRPGYSYQLRFCSKTRPVFVQAICNFLFAFTRPRCLAFLVRCYPRVFFIDADGHLIWMLCVWLTGLRTPQEMGDQAQRYAVSLQTLLILVILHLQTLICFNFIQSELARQNGSRQVMSICGLMLITSHQIWIRNGLHRENWGRKAYSLQLTFNLHIRF